MTGFFRSLFGSKKSASKIKPRIQIRRLELVGLEERITPVAQTLVDFTTNTGVLSLTSDAASFSVVANANGTLTVNSASAVSAGSSTTVTVLSIGNNNYTVSVNSGPGNVKELSLIGDSNNNNITVSGIDSSAFNADFGLNVDTSTGTDILSINGLVALKGTGALTTAGIEILNIAATGDITAASGAVSLSASSLMNTAGDITTTSGAINYNRDVQLTGNVAIKSTSGNLTMRSVGSNASSLSINEGTGTVTIGNLNIGTGNLTISSTATPSSGSAISLANVAAGDISLISAGDISVSGAIFAASVNAKSTAGDVIFADTVTTTQVGGFTSEATLSTKATKIANLVSVDAGASALITGNLVTTGNNTVNVSPAYVLTQTGPGITVTGTGAISITGKVDALASTNDLYLTAVNGAININGAVGSGTALDQLFVDGLRSFAANGAITANTLGVGFLTSSSFATSVSFADAVKVTGANYDFKIPNDNNILPAFALEVVATGAGTVSFSKTIEASNPAASVYLQSQNGNINVAGSITSKNGLSIYATGSGFVTLNDNVTTDQANGEVIISSNTGGISTKGVTTSGATANINIDTDTSGDIIIGGNISTSGGGDILLGTDVSIGPPPPYTATGAGNLTINGTVSTTGSSTSGDIAIGSGGTGTITVNKALSTGTATNPGGIYILALGNQINTINFSKDATITSGNIINFRTTGSTNTISFASGANITSAGDVTDSFSGPGNINLASNITTSNGLISFNTVSVSLAGPVSMKAGGQGGNINLGNTNGAQNLTLEATGNIVASSSTAIGGLTPLNSLTVVNSSISSFQNLNSANVTISDTTSNIIFNGPTSITNSLTTAAKAYSVSFAGTTVLSGTPVFLNTGGVSFTGTTSLTTGATITGNATSVVTLDGTIVSGGAFNIGAAGSTGVTNISTNTQLILNSTIASSTFASQIILQNQQAGTLKLLGVGTLTLSADSTAGVTTNDSIEVINGTLNVTGKLGNASLTSLTNGTITGAGGTIGALTVNTGTVAPGGTLNTGAITLNAATNYNAAILTNTTASNLKTSSAINLNGANLALSSIPTGLAEGDVFTIIDNTAGPGNQVNGIFAGLPERGTLSAIDADGNTVYFAISYVGGTGSNDVTLSVLGVVPQINLPIQPMVAGQPVLNKFSVTGVDAGGGPLVTVTFPDGTYTTFFAYASTFTGGVRVAAADVNGDGSLDIITGPGPGGGPQVNVFSFTPTGAVFLRQSFFAFNTSSFTGGVYVAAGDTNNDGFDDVVIGAGAGGGPRVQVYAGSATGVVTSSTLNDFFAYATEFTGGVVVAAGDRTGDSFGNQEVITGPASNGGFNVKSFDVNGKGNNPTVVDNFFAFNDMTSIGGLSLASSPLNGGPVQDILIGTTNAQFGVVLDQTGVTSPVTITTNPFPGFTGAIRAGVAIDTDGIRYAVAAVGPGGGPVISLFSVGANSLTQTDSLFVLDPAFTGGLFASS